MKVVEHVNANKSIIEYNGRILNWIHDRGSIGFINSFSWEDGSELTVDERVQIINEVYADKAKGIKKERIFPGILFVDQTGTDGYGNVIDYDDNFKPMYKIEDNKVIARFTDCECQIKYPERGLIESEYETLVKQIKKDKLLKRIKHSIFSKKDIYICTKCGQRWKYFEGRKPFCFWKRKYFYER